MDSPKYSIDVWQKGIYRPWKWAVKRFSDESVMTGSAWFYQDAVDASFAAYRKLDESEYTA